MTSEFDDNWALNLEVGLALTTIFTLLLMFWIC
jgi:hypothetical protein